MQQHLIGGKVQDYLEFDRDFAIAKIVPPVAVQGKNVSEINAIAPVTMLALRPRCERFRPALDDDIVNAGDLLIVSGPVEKLEDFASD